MQIHDQSGKTSTAMITGNSHLAVHQQGEEPVAELGEFKVFALC